ncbi:MAG: PAS domain S-box protein [Candidatus Omnitrophota bacterium]
MKKSVSRGYSGEDRRIDKFFSLSIDLLCLASLDGFFIDVNPAFVKTLGYSKEELLSVRFIEFVHEDDRQSTMDELKKLSQGKETLYFENRYRCKDGKFKWLGWTCPAPKSQTGLLYAVARDLTKYKESEEALKKSQSELMIQKKSLEKKNIALQEILAQIELEKKQLKSEIVANIEELFFPLLQKLKHKGGKIDPVQISMLEKNLKSITASFGHKISNKQLKLTPKEIEICNMIKNDLSSKAIAQTLNISLRTVDNHRNHIRSKLGLSGKNSNLITFLKSL